MNDTDAPTPQPSGNSVDPPARNTAPGAAGEERVRLRSIFQTWWPLATSWLLMSAELPLVSAVVARLAEPRISLAAYGGVVFPLAILIEAPIIMLLAASTALSKDWPSYCLVRRFMVWSALTLTVVHAAIAFTPLFDLVVGRMIGVPLEIQPAARIGLQIMTPWTASIAYRRFLHGIMIRFGKSHTVGIGTAIRLASNALTLIIGASLTNAPGIVVGATAVAVGVVTEAIFIGFRAQPVLKGPLRRAPLVAHPLTWSAFLNFYIPLALTSIILVLSMPIGSAAMSRMPRALDSLATWPVINGLLFLFRGVGIAFNEVVVARIEDVGALPSLRRFAGICATAGSIAFLLLALTPAATFWLATVSGLAPGLVALGRSALWIGVLLPGLAFLQSYYTGMLVHARKTRAITESVLISLSVIVLVLTAGTISGRLPGVQVALLGVTLGATAQVVWLTRRSRNLFVTPEKLLHPKVS